MYVFIHTHLCIHRNTYPYIYTNTYLYTTISYMEPSALVFTNLWKFVNKQHQNMSQGEIPHFHYHKIIFWWPLKKPLGLAWWAVPPVNTPHWQLWNSQRNSNDVTCNAGLSKVRYFLETCRENTHQSEHLLFELGTDKFTRCLIYTLTAFGCHCLAIFVYRGMFHRFGYLGFLDAQNQPLAKCTSLL